LTAQLFVGRTSRTPFPPVPHSGGVTPPISLRNVMDQREGMARGRRPEGNQALSNAERQARYRLRRQAAQPAAVRRYRQSVDRRSLAEQWTTAVAALVALHARYVDWHQALPEALLETATGEALQAIIELDLDEIAALEPPRGFGRD
jgi:hypothetical protein